MSLVVLRRMYRRIPRSASSGRQGEGQPARRTRECRSRMDARWFASIIPQIEPTAPYPLSSNGASSIPACPAVTVACVAGSRSDAGFCQLPRRKKKDKKLVHQACTHAALRSWIRDSGDCITGLPEHVCTVQTRSCPNLVPAAARR